MATVTQLIRGGETAGESAFQEFYKLYPHNPRRKDKAKARALFMRIVSPGGTETRSRNRDSGEYDTLHLEATPEEIIEGVKRFRRSLVPTGTGTYSPDTTYSPFASVWLNQGRWEDE